MTINTVLRQWEHRNVKVSVRLDGNVVCIDGDAEALTFIGEVVLALAAERADVADIEFTPAGAGFSYFGEDATLGIRFSRTDK